MRTRYVYSTIRFVPDPTRGEFVNIGLIVGSDESGLWELRTVENFKRAKQLDSEGALPYAQDAIRSLVDDLAQYKRSRGALFEPREMVAPDQLISEEWLDSLYSNYGNIVQFSPPTPIVAENIENAMEILQDVLLVDPKGANRSRVGKKNIYNKALKAYERVNLPDNNLQVRARVESSKYSNYIDFLVGTGHALQLSHTWSFQIEDENLKNRIMAWAWMIKEIRENGGRATLHGRIIYVPDVVDINVIHSTPIPKQREAFEEAREAFKELRVTPYSVDAVDSLAIRADTLLAKHRGDGAGGAPPEISNP